MKSAKLRAAPFVLLGILALGLLVYWPGLSGGYVFDDFGNLVDNAAFAQSALQTHFWHAIWSAHAGPLDRPLSMFSFAAQMVFTGMNPWPLKLSNVLLHLFNGWLIWLLSVRVLGWLEGRAPRPWLVGAPTLALLATAAWVLAPIQLTAVLYVIQREEALASAFVLLGLLAYWHGRMRLIAGRRGAMAWIWGSLAIGTAVAALAKETGVMLSAYAFVLEWVVLRGALAAQYLPSPALSTSGEGANTPPPRSGGGWEGANALPRGLHPLVPVFVVLLLIPGVLGLAWLLPSALNGSAYAARPFTLSERLLTEGRVLVDYLRWIVLPSPDALSLYHDDIALSTGWLSPWTTAASWAFLAALLGAALWLRKRLPLFAFGVLWWFAGQSLLSTFVPLELVYEHRNYLPDWGIFLALFALLFTWSPSTAQPPPQPSPQVERGQTPLLHAEGEAGRGIPNAAQRSSHLPHSVGEAGRGRAPDAERRGTLRLLTVGGVSALIALYGMFTAIRAQTWGNPYRLAYFEATTHPQSPRASYDLGRMMLITAQGVGSPQFQMGMRQMEQGALLPGADLQPLQALVFMSAKNDLPIQPRWWAEMHHIIATSPMSAEDVGALYSLIQCSINGVCHYTPGDVQQLDQLIAFAVQRNPSRADLVTLQANWAANLAHDNPLAYQLMLRAVALDPGKYDYWKNLFVMQVAAGLYGDAGNVLERMRELNRFGIHDAEIRKLTQELAQKMKASGQAQTESR
ncbi:MAG: hypothetical protein B7Z79_00550 [Thiomonas sp. 20-64-9]|jgi:hypothetical protein|uniref:hypothetical protein n=1 Tax=unclassified Thiomonas TaxID=2625466 RepID=UPI000BD2DB79|nr:MULTISPECIES: hypothetical protein [unclassified Thiomonas]OYV31948.1 MAG: hypothetical protein B7Z79_00550 [Thiomonas sp. 20-64-9]OZB71493.1 MAG: hypothetical protein B7X30_04515 [Thiomonas sp. 13-64-67]